ncbi:hypothetical protein [Nocardia australiensis]|uniref:hypothetical protein n=1 Tax=Nocardia australiensis TaxID=2887191 RepID=UPI001D14AF2B|nr:hypothetical protein [Nocardia australiensis]
MTELDDVKPRDESEDAVPPLKDVGIYRDMYQDHRAHLPLVADSYTDSIVEDRPKIIDYMKSVVPTFDVLEDAVDMIGKREWIRSAPSLVSDGAWFWRVDSIYYLETYQLHIPDAFLAHVRAQKYTSTTDGNISDELFNVAFSAYL